MTDSWETQSIMVSVSASISPAGYTWGTWRKCSYWFITIKDDVENPYVWTLLWDLKYSVHWWLNYNDKFGVIRLLTCCIERVKSSCKSPDKSIKLRRVFFFYMIWKLIVDISYFIHFRKLKHLGQSSALALYIKCSCLWRLTFNILSSNSTRSMENNQLDVEGRKVIIRIWIEYSWE